MRRAKDFLAVMLSISMLVSSVNATVMAGEVTQETDFISQELFGDSDELVPDNPVPDGKSGENVAFSAGEDTGEIQDGESSVQEEDDTHTGETGDNFGIEGKEFLYIITGEEVTIISYLGTNPVLVIPDEIEGKPVVGVGESAFQNNESIESAEFSKNIKVIGKSAFEGCVNLKKIVMHDNEEMVAEEGEEERYPLEIGERAFAGCINLTEVTFSKNSKIVDESAFEGCENLSVELLTNEDNQKNADSEVFFEEEIRYEKIQRLF